MRAFFICLSEDKNDGGNNSERTRKSQTKGDHKAAMNGMNLMFS
jgi:hypothetical protein